MATTIERLQIEIDSNTLGAERGFARVEKKAAGFGSKMKSVGRRTSAIGDKMTKGVTLPLIGLGAVAVKTFADFDAAMTKSTAIMGDVSDVMRDEMASTAREVAKQTKVSAEEAAEAYFFLASAGLDAEQSVAALPQVARFAQAGMFDMARATDLATDAQSALGLTSDDADENLKNLKRTTDVFVKANTLANASVEQFATSMTQKAGGALRSLDKDIEEGTAVLAVFADQGIKAERGGTILRATLDGLSKQARDNAAAFADHNVEVFDADGAMRNMADITADLEGALSGMSTEQREATLAQLGFNRRSREGLLALLGNSDALAEYEEELRGAAGTTESVADKQMETFTEQMRLLKDRFIDVAIGIGEALVPALLDIADALEPVFEWITDTAEAFTELDESTQRMILSSLGVVAAIGPVLSIGGRLLTLLGGLIGPWGLIAAAAAGAVVLIIQNWDKIGPFFQGVREFLDGVIEEFRPIFNRAKEIFQDVVDRVRENWPGIKEQVSDVVTSVQGLIEELLPVIKDLAEDFLHIAENVGPPLVDLLSRILSMEIGKFKAFVDAVSRLVGLLRQLVDMRPDVKNVLDLFSVPGTGLARDLLGKGIGALGGGSEPSSSPSPRSRPSGGSGFRGSNDEAPRSSGFRGSSLQHGGMAMSGAPHLVGERGPELFVPNISGRVIPTHQLDQSSGGGITVNIGDIHARTDDPKELSDHIVREMSRALHQYQKAHS